MKNKLMYVGLGSVLTLVLTVSTITFANNLGDINACINKTNGSVRIIDADGVKGCSKNERPLSWNAEGEQGPEGQMGPQGERGPEGPQGEPGDSSWNESRIAEIEARLLALESTDPEDPEDKPYDTTVTFSLSPDSPEATTLVVETFENTEFTIFIFDIETGEGGPITIEELAIRLDTPGGILEDIVDEVNVIIDGDWYDVDYFDPLSPESRMFMFEPDNFMIEAGESAQVEFRVEFRQVDDNYELGQTVQASVRASDTPYWSVEGYDDLSASEFFGEAIGAVHELNFESEED